MFLKIIKVVVITAINIIPKNIFFVLKYSIFRRNFFLFYFIFYLSQPLELAGLIKH